MESGSSCRRLGLLAVTAATAIALAPERAAAAPGQKTIVTAAELDGKTKRYAKRIAVSIKKAVSRVKHASLSRETCGVDHKCLASAGQDAEAVLAIGIAMSASGRRRVQMRVSVIEVATGNQIASRTVRMSRSRVRTTPGRIVRSLLRRVRVDTERDALTAVPTGPLTGNGRSLVPIMVRGGPEPGSDESQVIAREPLVRCEGAEPLPSVGEEPLAVLSPAVSELEVVDCSAALRGEKTHFQLKVDQPPAGVYARLQTPHVRAVDSAAVLEAFAIDDKGRRVPPSRLRASASIGRAVVEEGRIVVHLPKDKAPRTIAIALADGDRYGAAFVPVYGVTRLPVEARRAKKVKLHIAGREFGPVRVRRGRAKIKIEVPPGVRWALLRATARRGEPIEKRIDLGVPDRPRVAAVAPQSIVGAGDQLSLVVVTARANGRPAPKKSPIFVLADRGTISDPKPVGPGLWIVPYRAPKTAGADVVRIRVEGDDGAGKTTVKLKVVPDTLAQIDIRMSSKTLRPGDTVWATARVIDSHGNRLPHRAVNATLAGKPLRVVKNGHGVRIRLTIPERLPRSKEIPLVVTSGSVEQTRLLKTRALAPVQVDVRSSWRRNSLDVAIDARDKFGNQVEPGEYTVKVDGGELGSLDSHPDGARGKVTLQKGRDRVTMEVRNGAKVLFRSPLSTRPSPGDWVLGIVAGLGVEAPDVPRVALGARLTRKGRRVDYSAAVGVERSPHSGDENGTTLDTTSYSLVAGGQGRYRLGKSRYGLWLGASAVLGRTSIQASGAGGDQQLTEMTWGVRATAGPDARLGAGLLQLGVSYGTAGISAPESHGIDALAIIARYEWWFTSL